MPSGQKGRGYEQKALFTRGGKRFFRLLEKRRKLSSIRQENRLLNYRGEKGFSQKNFSEAEERKKFR